MDTLTHFIFSMMVGLAVAFRLRHKILPLIGIAFLSVLMDVDHFFGLAARGMFHNVFFCLLMPLVLFLYFYKTEKGIRYQTYSLILLVMLAGHVIIDTIDGVRLLYPFSDAWFFFPNILIEVTSEFPSAIVTSFGLSLAIYALVLLSALYVEDFIYFFKSRHEKITKALRDARRDML